MWSELLGGFIDGSSSPALAAWSEDGWRRDLLQLFLYCCNCYLHPRRRDVKRVKADSDLGIGVFSSTHCAQRNNRGGRNRIAFFFLNRYFEVEAVFLRLQVLMDWKGSPVLSRRAQHRAQLCWRLSSGPVSWLTLSSFPCRLPWTEWPDSGTMSRACWARGMGAPTASETAMERPPPQVASPQPSSRPKRSVHAPWPCTTPSRSGRTVSPSTGLSSSLERTTWSGSTPRKSRNGHILFRFCCKSRG